MKAVYFDQKINIIDNYSEPVPDQNEVLIKTKIAGICNTDLEIVKGYMNFKGILGHEFVGTIEKAPQNYQNLIGKRVVGEINCSCLKCEYCLKGIPTHCMNRKVLGIFNKDGAFGQYLTLPVKNIHIIDDSIKDEEAVLVEPLAAAFEILEQIHIKPTDKIIVLGDGKLGLLVCLVLKLINDNIILAGKNRDKLKIASDKNIKTITVDELKIEKSYDIVIEATGSLHGFETALNLVKPQGTIVLKTTVASKYQINLSSVVIDEIKIIGSRCGRFKPAIDALSNKKIDVNPLITKIYKFEKVLEALKKAQQKGSLKVLIDFR